MYFGLVYYVESGGVSLFNLIKGTSNPSIYDIVKVEII